MNSLKKENTVIGCILLAISAYYAYLTSQMQFKQSVHGVGPNTLPYLFSAVLAALAVLLIIEGFVKNSGPANKSPLGKVMFLNVTLLFAVLGAYILAIQYIAYLIATPIVLVVLLLMSGSRKPLEIILTSGLVTFGVFILFNVIFQVRI